MSREVIDEVKMRLFISSSRPRQIQDKETISLQIHQVTFSY